MHSLDSELLEDATKKCKAHSQVKRVTYEIKTVAHEANKKRIKNKTINKDLGLTWTTSI